MILKLSEIILLTSTLVFIMSVLINKKHMSERVQNIIVEIGAISIFVEWVSMGIILVYGMFYGCKWLYGILVGIIG